MIDPRDFNREQSSLAHAWTFLGLAKDVAKDGDWFRASLATRSVFVQRFGTELRGFENLCAHRFYPLRNEDTGNGPIVCGYHRWRYNQEGLALGIPRCRELYGVTARELGAKLTPIDVATCGTMIFGRFPSPTATESLEDFLAEGFPILKAMSRMEDEPQLLSTNVKANWKTCLAISLDDYHTVAVHPTTLGKSGYVRRESISYVRFGLHSAFLYTPEPRAFEKMATACRDGTFRSTTYCIFQILPNLIVVHFKSDGQFWHCLIQQIVPISYDLSVSRAWLYPTTFAADHHWHVRWTRPLTDPVRKRLIAYNVRKVFREDNKVCERAQTAAHQIHKAPLLGALEERVGWFNESYRELVSSQAFNDDPG
jgi:phenylpropionate dioxygenase-like ring-hydroxylating dioxygenase large terminal subunit